jgi:DNA-binding transcriptional LysR family regulator
MDRFESISTFVAVAKSGGFSAAAREMGIPLATVSRRVAQLEADLGARLLQRSTRQVGLTEQGKTFLAACERVLDDLREAQEAVTGEFRSPKGELAITAPTGFGRIHLQPVALEFLAAYPQIRLRLLLVDRVVNLLEEHVDLALRIGELPDSGLIARPLGHIRIVVAASPQYLARRGMPEHPRDLPAHDGISWTTLGLPDSWPFRIGAAVQRFAVRTRLVTTTPDSALAAAQAGLGLVQTTSYQAQPGVRAGSLVLLLRQYEAAPTPVSLVYASNRLLPLKLRAFVDFALPRLAARLESVDAAFA